MVELSVLSPNFWFWFFTHCFHDFFLFNLYKISWWYCNLQAIENFWFNTSFSRVFFYFRKKQTTPLPFDDLFFMVELSVLSALANFRFVSLRFYEFFETALTKTFGSLLSCFQVSQMETEKKYRTILSQFEFFRINTTESESVCLLFELKPSLVCLGWSCKMGRNPAGIIRPELPASNA